MNIYQKGEKEYTIEEQKMFWVVSNKGGALTVEYKVPKDICKTQEELVEYINKEGLF